MSRAPSHPAERGLTLAQHIREFCASFGGLQIYDGGSELIYDQHCNLAPSTIAERARFLYQWGTYDWGEGELFEFDITQQLIVGDGEDEDIFQLSLTFQFRPTVALRQLGSGDRWCQSPDGLDGFRAFIHSSSPLLTVGHEMADGVKLEYDVAG